MLNSFNVTSFHGLPGRREVLTKPVKEAHLCLCLCLGGSHRNFATMNFYWFIWTPFHTKLSDLFVSLGGIVFKFQAFAGVWFLLLMKNEPKRQSELLELGPLLSERRPLQVGVSHDTSPPPPYSQPTTSSSHGRFQALSSRWMFAPVFGSQLSAWIFPPFTQGFFVVVVVSEPKWRRAQREQVCNLNPAPLDWTHSLGLLQASLKGLNAAVAPVYHREFDILNFRFFFSSLNYL